MSTTIGILYPGEMGCAIGQLLAENGCHVVTTIQGRSARTKRLCEQSQLTTLRSLSEVVHSSEIILSLVPPAAALEVAQACRGQMAALEEPKVFIDANSISPLTAAKIADLWKDTLVCFVDAAIHGLASQLRTRGTIYFSGTAAAEIAEHFSLLHRVYVVGEQPGQASLLKMLLAGMSKGVVALFVELTRAAHRAEVLPELLANYQTFYPGLMELLGRLLPTYPRHAVRRGKELMEVEATLRALGLPAGMIHEAERTVTSLGQLGLCDRYPNHEADDWDLQTVIETVCSHAAMEETFHAELPSTGEFVHNHSAS